MRPEWMSARCCLYSCDPGGELGQFPGLAWVMSHSMPRCPNRAVAQRSDSGMYRPVWCENGADTCAPRYSGGTSWPVQRWIGCRASASVMSEVQTRSIRSSMARSIRPPPAAHDSHSTAGMPLAQPVEQRVDGQRLVVRGGGARPRRRSGVDDVAVAVPLDVGDRVLRQQRR